MASRQLGAALRPLQRLFSTGAASGLPDDQLLDRFASRRDEAAFEALVQRHGPMVLSVCRGLLRDPDDVQDAFQATFLVLVRKAGSIRACHSLGSWLYRVAYNMAVQTNADAARRREMERRAAEMTTPAGRDNEGRWESLVPALYEEVNRLPEKYRLPVVLCHLERMTHAQAAEHLGWTVGTVRGRVAKAREVLRGRLARRGLSLSAGAFSMALAERSAVAAAVPAAWVDATIEAAMAIAAGRAAAGAVSAAAVVFSERMLRTMFMSKLKSIGAALLLAVGGTVCVVGAFAANDSGARGETPRADKTGPAASKEGKDSQPVAIAGRILDPEGNPLPRATVYLRRHLANAIGRRDDGARPVATAGTDGRFRFDLDTTQVDLPDRRRPDGPAWHGASIAAVAPGFGASWANVGDAARSGAELRLVRDDVPIRGRVLDSEGRPVANAAVRVEQIAAPRAPVPDSDLEGATFPWDAYLTKSLFEGPIWDAPSWIGRDAVVTTDADGKFAITGVGRERVVMLSFDAPRLARSRVVALARPPKAAGSARKPSSSRLVDRITPAELPLYAAEFQHVLGPGRPISGVVLLKGTGEPVAGAGVSGQIMGKPWSTVRTTTDERGRYRLDGLPKSGSYRVDVRPMPGEPYLSAKADVTDTEGLQPIAVNLEVPSGVPIRGRVVDKQTGRAVRCDQMVYVPLPTNPHKEVTHFFIADADNAFRMTVPPGEGVIVAKATGLSHPYMPARLSPAEKDKGIGDLFPFSHYNAYRFVEIPAGAKTAEVDLEVTPGASRRVELVGPDGRPVAGATAYGLTPNAFAAQAVEGAGSQVVGLPPGESRLVEFRHEGLGLAGSAEVTAPGPEERPVVVTLVPLGTLSGRILDEDGLPLRKATITAHVAKKKSGFELARNIREVVTDAEGRFRIERLNPTLDLLLTIDDPNHPRPKFESRPDKDLSGVTVKPGEVHDLGDVRVRAEKLQ